MGKIEVSESQSNGAHEIITAHQARQISEKVDLFALGSELKNIDAQIRIAAASGQTSHGFDGKISKAAQNILEQNGFHVKDTSVNDPMSGYFIEAYLISWVIHRP